MELLSPAGGREALIAAVQNGADAVYLGVKSFNARRGAENFEGDGLYEAVAYCHARGAKVYVTLNTLTREDELEKIRDAAREIYLTGADAFIVQDIGVAAIARSIAPDMELHASTQMAVHNYQGVKFLAERGFERVVLAREMDFPEIRRCAGLGVKLEAFVHGALCVACSGQCLMSSLVGARSGNRGMCAQPCRLPYKLGEKEGYLLSTRDLMGVELLGKYAEAGVSSLKIEGRLKRPEYVAVVTGIYRRALDGAVVSEKDTDALRQIFNRGGFTRGYGEGIEDVKLMSHARPNNSGVRVGRADRRGYVRLEADIDDADQLCLRGAGDDRGVRLAGKRGDTAACPKAETGDELIRLASEAQLSAARESYSGENRAAALNASVRLRIGMSARLALSGNGFRAEAEGDIIARANTRGTDAERVRGQLRKTGGTGFEIADIELDMDENAFASMAQINALRRAAIAKLTEVGRACGEFAFPNVRRAEPPKKPILRAQSGDIWALKTALRCGADEVIFAPEDMRALDAALELDKFYLAPPCVMRAEELDALNSWANSHADKISGVYMSNVSQLPLTWPGARVADYMLNIANNVSLNELAPDFYTPSVELTARQTEALGGEKDIITYGRLPLMRLRHCPYRASRNMGGRHDGCARCDNGGDLPPLIDRLGVKFPLRRIAYKTGCVVEVLNSVPIMALSKRERLPQAGAWRMLIDASDAEAITQTHRAALDGRDPGNIDMSKYTTGHYFRGVE